MHDWVQNFKEKEAKPRETIALDETVSKVNDPRFYLYAALDWRETRSYGFLMDEEPWYRGVFQRLGVKPMHETFGRRSKGLLQQLQHQLFTFNKGDALFGQVPYSSLIVYPRGVRKL